MLLLRVRLVYVHPDVLLLAEKQVGEKAEVGLLERVQRRDLLRETITM